MIITLEGTTVTLRSDSESSVHRCATQRVAQIFATRTALVGAGWQVRELSSFDRLRRPLLLSGEKMLEILDGTRSDERAQGFVASRGDAWLLVDACAGLPLELTGRGDTADAAAICRLYLATPALDDAVSP